MYVHDLGLFLTVQLLEDTPAILSLGKLCEELGYSYAWVTGQQPRLTKKGKTKNAKTDHFVPLVVHVKKEREQLTVEKERKIPVEKKEQIPAEKF